MGNLGLATSFFNDKNRNLVKDLVELIVEANQDLPSWLEAMSLDSRNMFGGGGRRGGGGNRSKGGFGGRDYRYKLFTNTLYSLDSELFHVNSGSTRAPTEVVEAVAEETAWAAETALEGVVDALDLAEVAAAVDGLDLLEVSTLLFVIFDYTFLLLI